MSNKWMKLLGNMEGAVIERSDPWNRPLRSLSPSVNGLFGHTHGFPRGYGMLLWGQPKAGKSLLSYAFTAGVHRDSPDGMVIKFDTEFRDDGQLTPDLAAAYGIDMDRFMTFQVNDPALVFDRIKDEIGPMVEAGMPIDLIIIDSITGVQGRGEASADTEEDDGRGKKKKKKTGVKAYRYGDHAQTTKIGLKQILPTLRAPGRKRISTILTAHCAAEMDAWEVKRGNKERAAVAFGVSHFCEFFVNVRRDTTAEGRKDSLGNEMRDTSRKSMDGAGEATGHRIKVWMQNSSMCIPDREAEFVFDYRRGIVDTHEEVFRMGTNWGVIVREGSWYIIGGQRVNGEKAALKALSERPDLQQAVLAQLLEMEKSAAPTPLLVAPSSPPAAE